MKKQIFVCCCFLLLSTASYAQSYAETVWSQIQDHYEDMSDYDYSVKNYIVGMIEEDDETSWTMYFSSNYEYYLAGFCDEDCDDLDLYLYDDDGNIIESDTEEDDFPIITFSPSKSGRYKVEVSMYSCAVEPCYYGLSILEK